MAIVNERILSFAQNAEVFRPDLLPLVLFVNGSQPSAIFPYQNLRNHYYPEVQSRTIGRTFPPVGHGMIATFQGFGWGATYRLTDEQQRQLAIAMSLQNAAPVVFRTAKQ